MHASLREWYGSQANRAASVAERFWLDVPVALRRHSLLIAAAWRDGFFLIAWPQVALMLSLGALCLGLFEGATHGNPAPGDTITFTQAFPFMVAAAAFGGLSANLGLMIVIGYAVGDLLLGGFSSGLSPNGLRAAVNYRIAELVSYLVLFG